MRCIWRSAIFMALFGSSRPVQTFANMSSTTKSAIAVAARSPTEPSPPAVSDRLATSRYGVRFGSSVQTGLVS